MRWHAVIPAAGGGARFGGDIPKQYSLLDGKPVLLHAIERLAACLPLRMTYVVLAHDDRWFDRAIGARHGVTVLRCGGPTRATSVRNALRVLPDIAASDWIVVHDAVRPCVDPASIVRLKTELADDPTGGLLAIPVACTLKRADANRRVAATEPRDGLWQAQTPQMFRFGVLHDAFAQAGIEKMTDEAEIIESLGLKPKLVMGSDSNLKITFPDDLLLAEAILAAEQAKADAFDAPPDGVTLP
jgi:2-C-methyl-D-erythritol 4-phosphate cytidylyltransferase